MLMTIGGTRRFAVTLEDNPTARAQDVSVELQLHANRTRN